jgi:hypothetical protein
MEQKSPPTNNIEPRDGNSTSLVPVTPVQPQLSTLQQVRREMATLYQAAQRGDISAEELRGSIYALSQIAKVIELDKLEERMEALEQMAITGERTH